jgi:AraC-like DNA-binding protein
MSLIIKHLNYYIHPKQSKLIHQALPECTERIEILTTGKAWILHEGKDLEVGRGDILWHIEGDSAIYKSDPQNTYECLNIVCNSDTKCKRPYPRINKWHDIDEIDRFCHNTHKEYREGLIAKEIFNAHTLSRIEYQIAKSNISDSFFKFPLALKNAIRIIQKNYHLDLNIQKIAHDVQLSVTHLHDIFRTHLNISPHQYILKLKISLACQQLTIGREPIKRIADQCGFSNASSFCRSFKQHKSITPDQFRKKYS